MTIDMVRDVDKVTIYTMRDLNQDTAGTIRKINESGIPGVITRHNRFLAIIFPLAQSSQTPGAGVDGRLIAAVINNMAPGDVAQIRGEKDADSVLSSAQLAERIETDADSSVHIVRGGEYAEEQVKIRGYRIGLDEIQLALTALNGVDQAEVIIREDQPGDKRLVGYITGTADPAEVRAALAERMPSYMVPAAVVALTVLPLTASGELDKGALPAPESRQMERTHRLTGPSAFQRAEAARRSRAQVKDRLKRGGISLEQVLDEAETDEALSKMKVFELLVGMPRVDRDTAQNIMTELDIHPARRLRGLGVRQRQALLDMFESGQRVKDMDG